MSGKLRLTKSTWPLMLNTTSSNTTTTTTTTTNNSNNTNSNNNININSNNKNSNNKNNISIYNIGNINIKNNKINTRSSPPSASTSSGEKSAEFLPTTKMKTKTETINKTKASTVIFNAITRSKSSKSSLSTRPNTLNVRRNEQCAETKLFIRQALNAWRAKARCNVVPAERLQELFHELQFNPSEKQICEMLQTAKVFTRKGSKQLNGLTFGEFCVLAADLKRFRACNFSQANDSNKLFGAEPQPPVEKSPKPKEAGTRSKDTEKVDNKSSDPSNKENGSVLVRSKSATELNAPEVFLGGSCNPTTWRADVAIPTLRKLGISFYNPQVSDWTPDLIELEHRAKEKARVLFFVMDSETRASAGAIEAAHIAGQNAKHLVLVLHPYKPDQCILNEPISAQEFLDLNRNQRLLKELVTRRGLPVLDNIPSGLQRTRTILSGIRDPPSNIASILIVVRGAFDRVLNLCNDDSISLQQCQRALSLLGYAGSLLTLDNLQEAIISHRESNKTGASRVATTPTSATPTPMPSSPNHSVNSTKKSSANKSDEICVNFDEFCVLAAYLSVLQQEIHESGCISPIKGTNLPPPPIFLANMQEGIHNRNGEEHSVIMTSYYTKQISRTSSSTSVPDDRHGVDTYRNRDSGTSSPQPLEPSVQTKIKSFHAGKKSKICLNSEHFMINCENEEESDSNDSVFSSGSSINSNFCDTFSSIEFRDVYLGGSCYLRSKWRQDYAMPFLNSKGISYHMPGGVQRVLSDDGTKKSRTKRKDRTLMRISSKGDGEADSNKLENSDGDQFASSLALRPNLFNPLILEFSRVLLFVITNETRSLAPMTLAAHCIGLMYNVVLCVQMLPDECVIGNEKLTPAAIKDYNRGRAYLIDLAKRQGVPVFNDLKSALECTVEKVKACNLRDSV